MIRINRFCILNFLFDLRFSLRNFYKNIIDFFNFRKEQKLLFELKYQHFKISDHFLSKWKQLWFTELLTKEERIQYIKNKEENRLRKEKDNYFGDGQPRIRMVLKK